MFPAYEIDAPLKKELYFFILAVLGLCCSTQAFSRCSVQGLLLLWQTGLFACGILIPWPGIKPELLALQGRFLTLDYQGSPQCSFQ